MKKIIVIILLLSMTMVVRGDLLGRIQKIDNLIQQGKYANAEAEVKRLLADASITAEEKASLQNILNNIAKKKSVQTVQQTAKVVVQTAENEIDKIISEAVGEVTDATVETTDTGTIPITETDDVSDGSKFATYNNYEKAALTKKNPSTIFQLCELYFKDGLYERAVNLAKKDSSGDIRNLYVVAIGSRLIGRFDQSIDYYNKILSKSPRQMEAKLGLGIAYKSKGEYKRALDYLREYASSNPTTEVTREIAILNDVIANK